MGRREALASLVEAERAFARTSEEKGIREAFLTWLAPDAVVFRPGPVEGRPVYEKMDPANPTLLTWGPEFAESPRRARSAIPPARTMSGRAAARSRPASAITSRSGRRSRTAAGRSSWTSASSTAAAGLAARRPGGRLPRRHDPIRPLVAGSAARRRIRVRPARGFVRSGRRREGTRQGPRGIRHGRCPRLSARRSRRPSASAASRSSFPRSAGRVAPGTERRLGDYPGRVAWSGDLAYSFGTSGALPEDPDASEKTAFLRIWRKETSGIWKICLDIEFAVPPGSGERKTSPS